MSKLNIFRFFKRDKEKTILEQFYDYETSRAEYEVRITPLQEELILLKEEIKDTEDVDSSIGVYNKIKSIDEVVKDLEILRDNFKVAFTEEEFQKEYWDKCSEVYKEEVESAFEYAKDCEKKFRESLELLKEASNDRLNAGIGIQDEYRSAAMRCFNQEWFESRKFIDDFREGDWLNHFRNKKYVD